MPNYAYALHALTIVSEERSSFLQMGAKGSCWHRECLEVMRNQYHHWASAGRREICTVPELNMTALSIGL